MEVMGVVAVMVNIALLGMGGSVQRMFPNMTVTDRIILIVVLEVSNKQLFNERLPQKVQRPKVTKRSKMEF